MKTYDFVHLVLLAFDGKIEGRTKLQKTVYFVGALSGLLPELGFRPHYYGPYSSDVTAAIRELEGLGFLRQTSASAGVIDPSGFEVARYDYTLTPEGRQIADEKQKQFPQEWKQIKTAADILNSASDSDYIKLSIAAKMLYLLEVTKTESVDELLRMTPKFGWSVTSDQMNEAGRFLKTLGLVHSEELL